MDKGNVYWVTGLSGAGKTTVGSLLYQRLIEQGKNVVFLDGDILREVFQIKDYTLEGRKKLAFQYSRLCKMLADQNINVVICVIAMFDECREWNKQNIDHYFEIYLEVAMEELIRRDQKGMYTKALKKEMSNVMGIDIAFDEPKNPNVKIDNSGVMSPTEVVDIIMDRII